MSLTEFIKKALGTGAVISIIFFSGATYQKVIYNEKNIKTLNENTITKKLYDVTDDKIDKINETVSKINNGVNAIGKGMAENNESNIEKFGNIKTELAILDMRIEKNRESIDSK